MLRAAAWSAREGAPMLVIISDLHLGDESAARSNIPADAFAMWLDEMVAMASDASAQELVFLYLGDIFDLIRTEHWFYPAPGAVLPSPTAQVQTQPETFPLAHRPWGNPLALTDPYQLSAECRARALAISRAILGRSADQLALLRGDLDGLSAGFRARFGDTIDRIAAGLAQLVRRGVPVHRLYIPGNHDRLARVLPDVGGELRRALAASMPDDPELGLSDHALESQRYGVLARHGHEWDVWNFEAFKPEQGLDQLAPGEWAQTPIGDVITTELVARCPFDLWHRLGGVRPQVRDQVYEHLKHVEDVRPLHAALIWALAEGRKIAQQHTDSDRAQLLGALDQCVQAAMESFITLPFTREWLRKHDRFNLRLDEADQLQDVARLLRLVKAHDVATLLGWLERLQKMGILGGTDPLALGAQRELERAAPGREGPRYCVYGHTHAFAHEPIGLAGDVERVYFNSGTWRPRVLQTHDRLAFLGVKEMTYLVFFSADEDRLDAPTAVEVPKGTSYRTWNGFMLKRPRR
jgi:UDP-2,3-diacylglucosamine pyrophosphatase LpxH